MAVPICLERPPFVSYLKKTYPTTPAYPATPPFIEFLKMLRINDLLDFTPSIL